MKQIEADDLKQIIALALHIDCGGGDCGADEIHIANAETVIETFEVNGLVVMRP